MLANLAEVVENQSVMVEEGLLQHLKFVLRSKNFNVQRESARAIANLAAEYSHTAEIASGGALPPLVATLRSPDVMCQRYAAMGIGNLATHLGNQDKILLVLLHIIYKLGLKRLQINWVTSSPGSV